MVPASSWRVQVAWRWGPAGSQAAAHLTVFVQQHTTASYQCWLPGEESWGGLSRRVACYSSARGAGSLASAAAVLRMLAWRPLRETHS